MSDILIRNQGYMNSFLLNIGIDGKPMSVVFAILIFGLFLISIIGLVVRFVKVMSSTKSVLENHGIETVTEYVLENHGIETDTEFVLENHGIETDTEYVLENHGIETDTESVLENHGIETDGTYGSAYASYKSSLFVDANGKSRSLISFSEYVDAAEVAPVWFPTPRLSTSIPSILTILGILGTFIVLVGSLGSLGENPDAMATKVGFLLKGTQTAYFKSVWGVACSLCYSFIERWTTDIIQRNVARVVRKVDADNPVVTTEEISREILLATQDMSTKLNGFEKTMTAVATKGAASQNETIKGLLTSVVEEFRDQMVNGVKEGLQQLTSAMDQSSDRLKEFSTTADGVTERLSGTINRLSDIHDDLSGNIEVINLSLESLFNTMDAAKLTTERCLITLKQMADGTEASQDAINQLRTALQKLESTTTVVQQCQIRSEENLVKMSQTVREIDETLSSFTGNLDNGLTNFTDRFGTVADTLTGAGHDFANQVSDHVQTYCSALDKSLATAVTSLKLGITELQDGVVPSAESLGRSVGTISQTMTHLNEALTRLQPSADKLKQMAELVALLKANEIAKDEASK